MDHTFLRAGLCFPGGHVRFSLWDKTTNIQRTACFLFTRGVWLVIVELVIVNFGWTFDTAYSFLILQVIWAIGLSMLVLSALVFLPDQIILLIGIVLVFGHNLLDPITVQGTGFFDFIWYILHQPRLVLLNERAISIFYPVLPWAGLMALGYVTGNLFRKEFPISQRMLWLLFSGIGATALFIVLRQFNLYGEPSTWQPQDSAIFTWISFLNTTKYPPSLQFILMTMGPALIFLALSEIMKPRVTNPLVVFGRVPLFFYILHIYFIHALALLALSYAGRDWREYILSAGQFLSGRLDNFGFGLEVVYIVWVLVVLTLYPLCRWYQKVRENNPASWWLSYL